MHPSVDLNLLRTLQALLQERSVTRAAQRLRLSQPATSAALGRLRRHFNDELLTRVGNAYRLTPLATELLQRTATAIAATDRVFSLQPEFDPRSADRRFTLVLSDYATSILGSSLSRLLDAEGPHIRLDLRHVSTALVDAAPEALRDIDGVVLPHGFLTDLPFLDLVEDEWVCLISADHPGNPSTLSLEQLGRLPWVLTFHERTAFTTAARELRMHGVEPEVRMVTESYASLPDLIAGTSRVALVQRRLTAALTSSGRVRVLPCPFPAAPLKLALWWHPIHTADPGHRWFRHFMTEAACFGA
ncbi:LysR family transcriptional regulator [Cryptosporangium aurantiacum]|uniref:Transcriptional regulator, LysR family n=1 Tax=Cryptosporangium aurantiacum TaxID=134849 RepID=A0A1M7PEB1_9ACTN|nr:LysR family transcriptional regulator [Cryptosporangium aurantiacum]SHN15302.1 transcriptional regulator, LysR family [Cryptosporangium aurantiacum]